MFFLYLFNEVHYSESERVNIIENIISLVWTVIYG